MNKLFAIALLFGVISTQQVLSPGTGLNIDPRDVHHFDEKKNIEDAVHNMHDKPAKKWGGLFHKKDGQKSRNPSHNMKAMMTKMRKQTKKAAGNRRLQATDRGSVLKKLATSHQAKKDFISAKKAKTPLSAQMKEKS